MKIMLDVLDRMSISTIYPSESGILEQIMVRDISRKVELTQEEIKAIELVQSGNSIRWNEKKADGFVVEVLFSDAEIEFLKSQVSKLDAAKQVTKDNLGICLKISYCDKSKKTDE